MKPVNKRWVHSTLSASEQDHMGNLLCILQLASIAVVLWFVVILISWIMGWRTVTSSVLMVLLGLLLFPAVFLGSIFLTW